MWFFVGSHGFREIQQEDYLWKFVRICGFKAKPQIFTNYFGLNGLFLNNFAYLCLYAFQITFRVMTTSTPHRHIKKRLIKTVGAHTPCSCGYMQDGELYFYIKDYQGNVRVVLNQANQPVEMNSYYPYGGLMAATTTEGTQPYKYSSKELDRENGLDLYDSKARMYDPTIGRTPTQDPMAEKYYSLSPYAWCAGNPIRLVDLDGKDPIYAKKGFLFWKHVELIGDDGKQSSNSYLVRGNVQKNVEAATKNGEKYNGDLSESNDVILIPTGQLLNDVIQSVNDTKASGKENGGHAYSGDNNATRWDEGSYATQEIQENATITKASLSPFVVGGNNVEPKDASNLKIWWHVHPKVTIGEATLGNSIPSENDKNFQTKMQSRGYTGNTFVIGAGSNTVTFFNKRTLMTVS